VSISPNLDLSLDRSINLKPGTTSKTILAFLTDFTNNPGTYNEWDNYDLTQVLNVGNPPSNMALGNPATLIALNVAMPKQPLTYFRVIPYTILTGVDPNVPKSGHPVSTILCNIPTTVQVDVKPQAVLAIDSNASDADKHQIAAAFLGWAQDTDPDLHLKQSLPAGHPPNYKVLYTFSLTLDRTAHPVEDLRQQTQIENTYNKHIDQQLIHTGKGTPTLGAALTSAGTIAVAGKPTYVAVPSTIPLPANVIKLDEGVQPDPSGNDLKAKANSAVSSPGCAGDGADFEVNRYPLAAESLPYIDNFRIEPILISWHIDFPGGSIGGSFTIYVPQVHFSAPQLVATARWYNVPPVNQATKDAITDCVYVAAASGVVAAIAYADLQAAIDAYHYGFLAAVYMSHLTTVPCLSSEPWIYIHDKGWQTTL
jgi:hypothetical protein